MGLFKKKEDAKAKKDEIPTLPELPPISGVPSLPRLPSLPQFSEMKRAQMETLPALSDFEKNPLDRKFSEYKIKEAVTGEKEAGGEEAYDFAEEMQPMQKPRQKEKSYSPSSFEKSKPREAEPLFIRIDKFEEGSKTFEEARRQVAGIEKMFEELKRVKEDEDKELKQFEEKIRKVKEEIERVDAAIFSKVG